MTSTGGNQQVGSAGFQGYERTVFLGARVVAVGLHLHQDPPLAPQWVVSGYALAFGGLLLGGRLGDLYGRRLIVRSA